MSDIILQPGRSRAIGDEAHSSRTRRRHAADKRLQAYGLIAIGLTVAMLALFLGSIFYSGFQAFTQTKVRITLNIQPSDIPAGGVQELNFRTVASNTIASLAPEGLTPRQMTQFEEIFSTETRFILRDYILANADSVLGRQVEFLVPVSDPFDQLYKGVIPRTVPALSGPAIREFDSNFVDRGLVMSTGRPAVRVDLYIDPAKVSPDKIAGGDFAAIIAEGLRAAARSAPADMLAPEAAAVLRDYVQSNPDSIGRTLARFELPLSPAYAELAQGRIPQVFNPRFDSEAQINAFYTLVDRGLISSPLNTEIVTNPDSRFPELAGLHGAIVGSFYALLVCFLISFPVGIAAAVYLEEFAPKNRWTDLIEVNINNLAAVPSVVFGLLGLALFINTFGLPRSAPLVGGMVLALMTLPTIIVATRAALKAVPPSIREAALGMGASRYQVMIHHVLPLAMPGILTGTIIGLAQALGETAPLLLIGMNAFISAAPGGILDPATSLPTQIFSWADSPERGFVSRTSAAIIVLLGFLVIMNLLAVFLRQRFEKKW